MNDCIEQSCFAYLRGALFYHFFYGFEVFKFLQFSVASSLLFLDSLLIIQYHGRAFSDSYHRKPSCFIASEMLVFITDTSSTDIHNYNKYSSCGNEYDDDNNSEDRHIVTFISQSDINFQQTFDYISPTWQRSQTNVFHMAQDPMVSGQSALTANAF